jgi:hypothetical protein
MIVLTQSSGGANIRLTREPSDLHAITFFQIKAVVIDCGESRDRVRCTNVYGSFQAFKGMPVRA